MIDLSSSDSTLLLNPRMPAEERQALEALYEAAPRLPAHVWIATSGTSGALKLTALSHDALRISAAAVNRHLEATSADVWACVLPTFHVGGLGIHVRAELSGARVVSVAWSAQEFAAACEREGVTLSALVPAQLHDLVVARLPVPPRLRAIIIGGAALSPELYAEARAAGWPVLPSYGMTECCSQIATAGLASLRHDGDPPIEILDHVEVRIEDDGRIAVRSRSLLSGYALRAAGGVPSFVDPKVDGWFVTEDVGRLSDASGRAAIVPLGRRGEFVKVGGESVDLRRLDAILEEIVRAIAPDADAAIFPVADERLGHVIHLAATSGAEEVAAAFNARVLPFERARQSHTVEAIPRSPLRKLLRVRLAEITGRR